MTARADLIELSDAGLAALRQNQLVAPQAHASGKGGFLEGQIVVLRDATDQPTLRSPSTYFMFHPLKGPFTETDAEGKPQPGSNHVRLEFAWVHGITQEIDTLDDVRGMVSNRDLRYASGAEALDALLADIDPQGLLRVRRSSPEVADKAIVAREGWLSRYLISGPMSREDRAAEMARLREMPHEDPLSLNPIDPRNGMAGGDVAMNSLLAAIAHCAKWGEPEPGLQASCRAVAHLICDSIFVEPADVSLGAREDAKRLNDYSVKARRVLLTTAGVGSVESLSSPPPPGQKPVATRLVTAADSVQPVDLLDEARAALEVLDDCRNQPDRPGQYQAIDTLVRCAAGRADFRAAGTRRPLPPEFAAAVDALGGKADEVLLHFVAVPPAGTPDTGAAFRRELRPFLVAAYDPATAHAARDALARAGLGDDAEIKPLLDDLFAEGLHTEAARGDIRDNVIFVIKRLPGFIADPSRLARFQAEVNQRVSQYDFEVRANRAGPTTKLFLDQLAATP